MNNILVTRSSMPSFEEYCEEIKDIWDSHWLTNMGVKHKELQKNWKTILEFLMLHYIPMDISLWRMRLLH